MSRPVASPPRPALTQAIRVVPHPWVPPARGPRPRVLVLADVPNWAWARKARSLAKHLAGRIDVTVAIGSQPDARKLIEAGRHDLYHTFEVVQVGSIPLGWPMITGITAHVLQNFEQQRGPGAVRGWAARAKGFHANSRMLQRELEAYLGYPVHYVPNGVDEDFWLRSRPRESKKLVVGHVARPNPRKGADLVAAACRRAGVELRTVDRKSKNAFTAEEMRDFYQGIHVLAVSSDMDGTPNPALEAASCQCAVVSNPIGNMPEFIAHGVNGLLTERTVDSLAAALASLAARPIAEVEEMGRAARRTIEAEWTWATMAKNYEAMWRACL
jgi:glycosyltransferase involved in cell wall biosynthesis